MGNISSINHHNFARLHELTNNYNKATLLDKLIYWWQISTYTLNDDKIWFTRSINQIATDSKLSRRSVERYLHDFEETGLIERTNKLFKKKHLYIRITEKLLGYVSQQQTLPQQPKNITENLKTDQPVVVQNPHEDKQFFEQHGVIDNAKMAVSINKDQDNKNIVNNTVNLNQEQNNNTLIPKAPLSEQSKRYIKGMLTNLQQQFNLKFSAPEQLFSEIMFTITHSSQLQGVDTFKHRVQIIAKLLRQKRWKTPRGYHQYHNHLSELTTNRNHLASTIVNQFNQELHSHPANHSKNKTQLQQQSQTINGLLATEQKYLIQVQSWFNSGKTGITVSLINNIKVKIQQLIEQQERNQSELRHIMTI